LAIIARSKATKQSTLRLRAHGLLRFARNDELDLNESSSPVQAGDPVRRGFSVITSASGILDRPVKPGDDEFL
jgi:hypothetical protein